jgi:chromosome segregation ATPase
VSASDIVAPLITGIFSASGAGAFVAYIRDRRSDKARGEVASATVDVEVETSRLGLIERQMKALEKSFDTERKALLGTIRHVREDLEAEQVESAKKDEKIAKLTLQVDEIQKALDLVKAELAGSTKPTEPRD